MKTHPDLIGSFPPVNALRDKLDAIIARFEQTKPEKHPEFGLMTPTDVKLYVKETLRQPAVIQRCADGITIELCAQHFYGLRGEDFDTIEDFLQALKALREDERRDREFMAYAAKVAKG